MKDEISCWIVITLQTCHTDFFFASPTYLGEYLLPNRECVGLFSNMELHNADGMGRMMIDTPTLDNYDLRLLMWFLTVHSRPCMCFG